MKARNLIIDGDNLINHGLVKVKKGKPIVLKGKSGIGATLFVVDSDRSDKTILEDMEQLIVNDQAVIGTISEENYFANSFGIDLDGEADEDKLHLYKNPNRYKACEVLDSEGDLVCILIKKKTKGD